mmetsp:Transcript_34593/g.79115  ORF Transcript_34593/g.79115 Transcript_34593/m.79115 type:complete len:435 (+) Transcript_34593:147-1451(+)
MLKVEEPRRCKVEIKTEAPRPQAERVVCKRQLKEECAASSLKKEAVRIKVKKSESNAAARLQEWGAKLFKRGLELRKVKQEAAQAKRATRKRKASRKFREARSEVMQRSLELSPELASYLGAESMSRPEAVKQMWGFCRERGMLNPEDRREILFSEDLQQFFGKRSARIHDLLSLMAPHFRYGDKPTGSAQPQPPKKVEKTKHEAMKVDSSQVKAQTQTKQENLLPAVKQQPAADFKVEASNVYTGTGVHAKQEPAEQTLHSIRLRHMDRTSLGVEVVFAQHQNLLPVSCKEWHVIAIPVSQGHFENVSARCISQIHETADGDFEELVEACLCGLEPGCSYHISIVRGTTPDHSCLAPALKVPQRLSPKAWTREETSWWATGLKVPQLLHKVHEYNINGQVLFSLGIQDLKELGIAPCLAHRVMAHIDMLRAIA